MKGIKWKVNPRAGLLGTGIGVVTMVTACTGAAGLMAGGTVGLESMDLFAAGILVAAGLVGGLAALLGGGNTADAALTALGELVVLFALNAMLSGGRMEGIGVTVLALAGGSGAAILFRLGKPAKRKRRRRR